MKKMFLLCFLFIQAFTSDIVFKDIKNILRGENSAIVLLEDNTFWKIFSAQEISQTWTQWWYNVIPDNPDKRFLCDFSKWEFFSKVEIIPFDNHKDLTKYHNDEINSCTFLFKHQKTGTFAFARPLGIEEFVFEVGVYEQRMERLLKEEYDKGYSSGYSYGYSVGHSAGYSAGLSAHHN